MCIWIHVKYPLFSSDFNENWISSTDFRKILKYHISLQPVRWEPSCSMRTEVRTDGRTDRQPAMTKPIVVFHNFANAPKNRFSVLKIMSHINLQTRTVAMSADTNTIRYLVIAVYVCLRCFLSEFHMWRSSVSLVIATNQKGKTTCRMALLFCSLWK